MTRYLVCETFMYELEADNEEQAREIFEAHAQAGFLDNEEEGVVFVGNELEVTNVNM